MLYFVFLKTKCKQRNKATSRYDEEKKYRGNTISKSPVSSNENATLKQQNNLTNSSNVEALLFGIVYCDRGFFLFHCRKEILLE